VRPYASLLMDEPQRLSEHLQRLVAQGFRAFKIGWGAFGRVDARTDEAIVAAARFAVGPDVLLAVDAGGSDAFWAGGYAWALRTARMLADHDVAWFEEALRPDALEEFVALRRSSPVRISGGEVLTRRQEFAPYLRAGAFDIVQPDATKCGGLSESRRIGWLAQETGARLIPHGWNTGVGLAADLQLASALADTDLVEYKTGSAYIDDIVAGGWDLDAEGMLTVPHLPGLGVALDTDQLARYTPDAGFLGNVRFGT
jgi:L-alanine-DL-glutamate epimerase-like enolase superfamily enzyme